MTMALVVFETMCGNCELIAHAVAEGVAEVMPVDAREHGAYGSIGTRLREWLEELPDESQRWRAAFDTRATRLRRASCPVLPMRLAPISCCPTP